VTDPTVPSDPVAAPPRSAAGDASSRLGGRGVLIGFALVLGVFLLLAAIAAALIDAPDAPPDCPPGTECGGPPPAGDANASTPREPTVALPPAPAALPPGTVGIRAGTPWTSTEFGFEFEYPELWAVDTSDGRRADLVFQGGVDALLIVAGVPAADASAEAYADRWFNLVKDQAADLRIDSSDKNAILGPSIGAIDGVGRTYAGTWTTPQGATTPVGLSLVTATDGQTTVAVVLVTWNPDQRVGSTWLQYAVRGTAEMALKTFRWGPTS
jgi:hypothetical protein